MSWRRHRDGPSADRWVVPYADFLTLLLALFVVLYAASAVDAERFQDLAEGVRQRFGALSADTSPLPMWAPPTTSARLAAHRVGTTAGVRTPGQTGVSMKVKLPTLYQDTELGAYKGGEALAQQRILEVCSRTS